MKHIKSFQSHNEELFGLFNKPETYRDDMKVSKRMKENDIQQIFDKIQDSKKEQLSYSWLVHGKDKVKVAKLEVTSTDDYGKPIISLSIFQKGNPEKIIKSKSFYDQDEAIHFFLNWWETQTPEGKEKNKAFRLKKY